MTGRNLWKLKNNLLVDDFQTGKWETRLQGFISLNFKSSRWVQRCLKKFSSYYTCINMQNMMKQWKMRFTGITILPVEDRPLCSKKIWIFLQKYQQNQLLVKGKANFNLYRIDLTEKLVRQITRKKLFEVKLPFFCVVNLEIIRKIHFTRKLSMISR